MIVSLDRLTGGTKLVWGRGINRKDPPFILKTHFKSNIQQFKVKLFQRNSDFEISGLAITEKISDVKTLISSKYSKLKG